MANKKKLQQSQKKKLQAMKKKQKTLAKIKDARDPNVEKKESQSDSSRSTFGSSKSSGQQGSLGSPKIHRPQGG